MVGYIYVLSNDSIPGLYKIGCTSRSPYERANELYTTGVPTEFNVEYYIKVDGYETIEKNTHRQLINFNKSKEWFSCDLYTCISTIKKMCYNLRIYDEYFHNNQISNKIEYEDIERKKQEQIEQEILRKQKLQQMKDEAEFQDFKNKELKKASKFSKIFTIIWGLFFICLGIYLVSTSNNQSTKNILFCLLFFCGIGGAVLIFGLNMGDDGYYAMRGAKDPYEFDKWARKKFNKQKYR